MKRSYPISRRDAALSIFAIALAACSPPPTGQGENSMTSADPSSPAVRVLTASPYSIRADAELTEFVNTTARAAYAANCQSCHGAEMQGGPGIPNLVDYDWLWGVTGFEANDAEPVMAIQQTLLYGVRNKDCPDIADVSFYGGCADTRYSEMPGYGALGYSAAQINDLVQKVIDLSGGDADAEAVARAESDWVVCTECHGENGMGYKPYGGPDLTDDIWLYGGDAAAIFSVISTGRLGTCPPWGKVLDAATIKSLAVYIWNTASGY
ncbi:MAG TPA: c-type cytochrome [Gammaproteobacteria bacterium]|nr:c-type cytochrome [Gammaproteobacteria bacterium]